MAIRINFRDKEAPVFRMLLSGLAVVAMTTTALGQSAPAPDNNARGATGATGDLVAQQPPAKPEPPTIPPTTVVGEPQPATMQPDEFSPVGPPGAGGYSSFGPF